MPTCKDCLHLEACVYLLRVIGFDVNKDQNREGADKRCSAFTDKSRFVELPCKAGDVVYRVSFFLKHIIPLTVEGFLFKGCSWQVRCTWVGNQKEHNYIAFSSFEKTAFLTHEEAEAALAERMKENG